MNHRTAEVVGSEQLTVVAIPARFFKFPKGLDGTGRLSAGGGAPRFTVVCADLRGYWRSGCPASTPDHAPYAKRAMAADMVRVMEEVTSSPGTRPSRRPKPLSPSFAA